MNLLYLGGVVLTYALGVGSVTDSVSRMPLVHVDANTSTLESTNVPAVVAAKDHNAAVDISSAVMGAAKDHKRNGEVLQATPSATATPKPFSTEADCPLFAPVLLEARSLTEAKKKITAMFKCVATPQGSGFTNSASIWLNNRAHDKTLLEQVCNSIEPVERSIVLSNNRKVTIRILGEKITILNGMRMAAVGQSICIFGQCECKRG